MKALITGCLMVASILQLPVSDAEGRLADSRLFAGSTARITGRITRHDGTPVPNVQLSTIDASGNTIFARSNPFGYFRFLQLPLNHTYVVRARGKGYWFPERQVLLTADVANFDFIADKN